MVTFMIDWIILAIIILFIFRVEYLLREILNKPKSTSSEVAVTRGVYAPTVESNTSGDVGISEAKTPQLIEWEAEQELLKRNQSL